MVFDRYGEPDGELAADLGYEGEITEVAVVSRKGDVYEWL
jgi:hypothetical protein